MSAIEPLGRLMGVDYSTFSSEESALLEAEFFIRVYQELIEWFREEYKNYFYLMRFTREKENAMLEFQFVRLIIQDIVATGEYNLKGIAHYTDVPEEVIEELAVGRNTNPSAVLLRRMINLHRSVRSGLYQVMIKKINMQLSEIK